MQRPRGFTLIELLVVVSIIALLIAILLPVLGRTMETAKDSVCKSNLRQLGIAQASYAADFNRYPASWEWIWNSGTGPDGQPFDDAHKDPTRHDATEAGTLFPYTNNVELYLCPVAADTIPDIAPQYWGRWRNATLVRSYTMNWNVGPEIFETAEGNVTIDDIARPSEMVINCEENTFRVPRLNQWSMQDGIMIARNTYRDFDGDSFASFHSRLYGERARLNSGETGTGANNAMASGMSQANFADGHVEIVDPWQEVYTDTSPPGPWNGYKISATLMYTMDSIPVQ
ncbi:MAG: prepilin-type N-terminal cleavage/methylation domain-containing protein [Phycisphaeraceae bacterium]